MASGPGGGFGGSFVAGGNITPARFVRLTTTSGSTGFVVNSGAGEAIMGISQQGTRNPSYPGLQDGFAAITGENVRVYLETEETMIEVDASYNPGTLLKSGAIGIGTQVTANNDIYGAVLLDQSTAANQLVKCRVRLGYYGA